MAAPVLSSTPIIFSSWFCPFAQRVLIAAHAKKPAAHFAVHELSFQELFTSKPQWLLDLNPEGLVPFMAWKSNSSSSGSSSGSSSSSTWDTQAAVAAAAAAGLDAVVVRESLVCNEYLEDKFPDPPLLPSDPVGRAAARLLTHRVSNEFVTAFIRVLKDQRDTQSVQEAAAARLDDEITWLMSRMSSKGPLALSDRLSLEAAAASLDDEITWLMSRMSSKGPLALSDRLSLVDCAVAPHLLRLYILRHYAGYRYKGPAAVRLRQYCKALKSHPAVAATLVHPEGLDYREELLKVYAHYGVSLVFNHRAPLW
ncbi:hypothetical protein OEZ85_000856 [Tetradesmus obliquus]|uniref:GST N-terminal domain-containing protein n=1 Tax=Tetradesmus obliquus TaxID=3088 RepID=A0ABY8UJH2_TETOB|nr:hypothetical protein OEZ85_000856 [Tetradesmus obliquus]